MSRKHFTDEQVEQLRMNHYVRNVSNSTVSFTEEFKQLFYQKRQQGYLVKQIFTSERPLANASATASRRKLHQGSMARFKRKLNEEANITQMVNKHG